MHGTMCLFVLVCSFVASLKAGTSKFVLLWEQVFLVSRS